MFRRDNWTCQYCGTPIEDKASATVDHIIPHSLGGSHLAANLRTACRSCNSSKGDRSEHWLKLFRAFERSRYVAIITLDQYHKLLGLGVALEPLEIEPFFYEAAR